MAGPMARAARLVNATRHAVAVGSARRRVPISTTALTVGPAAISRHPWWRLRRIGGHSDGHGWVAVAPLIACGFSDARGAWHGARSESDAGRVLSASLLGSCVIPYWALAW
jgi:hypothetical protein